MLGVSVIAWADMCRGAGRLGLPAVCIRGGSVPCAAAGFTVDGERLTSLCQCLWLLTSVLADVVSCIFNVVVLLISWLELTGQRRYYVSQVEDKA